MTQHVSNNILGGYGTLFGFSSENANSTTNSSIASSIIFIPPPSPDLLGESFDIVEDNLDAGGEVNLTYNIKNNGEEAGQFKVQFYLSRNNYISKADELLGTAIIKGLEADSSTGEQTITLTLPDSANPFWRRDGDYFIGMRIDADKEISENFEGNNANTGRFQDFDRVNITVNPVLPDLSGEFFQVVQSELNSGESLDLIYNINNSGGEAGKFKVKFYLSRNDFISKGDLLLGTITINGIDPNSSTGFQSINLTLPEGTDPFWRNDGSYYVGMIIDTGRQVTESNERNNKTADKVDVAIINQVTATWTGDGDESSFFDANNWDISEVPTNIENTRYSVVIPDSPAPPPNPIFFSDVSLTEFITFNPPINVTIKASTPDPAEDEDFEVSHLSLGDNSILTLLANTSLNVLESAEISGIIRATGGDFSANNAEFVGDRARIAVSNGAQVVIDATHYSSKALIHNASTGGNFAQDDTEPTITNGFIDTNVVVFQEFSFFDLMRVSGEGSLLDLSKLETIDASFDDSNTFQSIIAESGGKLDLSGVKNIIPPVGTLFDITVTGFDSIIDLSSLQAITGDDSSGEVMFNIFDGTLLLGNFTLNEKGSVSIEDDGTVEVSENYTQLEGSTTLDGGNLNVEGLVSILGGFLTGNGTISANTLINASFISPETPSFALLPVFPSSFEDFVANESLLTELQINQTTYDNLTNPGDLINSNLIDDYVDFSCFSFFCPFPPVNETGIIDINGNYTQTGAGELDIDIFGSEIDEYDQLIISDTAILGGKLDVSLVGEFMPLVGDSFEIISFGSRIADFDTINLPTLGDGLAWETEYDADSLTLVVV